MGSERMPVGVFTGVGADLGAAIKKVRSLGLSTVQLSTPPADARTQVRAREVARAFSEAGVRVTLVFCGFPGERYDSIPIVRQTVGLVPSATRAERVTHTKQIADFAAWVGAPGIGIHIGFVSEDRGSAEFSGIVETVRGLAGYCAERGLTMNLETGQETADTLLHLLQSVGSKSLAVNFDPANMILYGSGQPLDALRKVGRYVRSVHCKDATWSDRPRETWGEEVPLGKGQVDIRAFVATLAELGYKGALTIEREISGQRQIEDIRAGVELLETIKKELKIGAEG